MQLRIYGNVILIHKGSVCVNSFLQYATMILK